jgi:acetyl-CoA carboxylase biotin carboxyl carrier protein
VNLTEKDVREILRLLDESGYDELKLETDGFNLTLRQSSDSSWKRSAAAAAPKPATVDETAHASSTPADAGAGSGAVRDIYPPLPGTFYRAPSPGAEPFVEVGTPVQEDTIVGLVETMKLMNSVMAGCRGEVIEICVDNGALIEAQDVLLRIREIRE